MSMERALNILVVDRDEDHNVESKSLLANAGHRVQVLCDCDQALEAVERGGIDLVLVALDPAERAGTELLSTLRAGPPGVRAFGMTDVPEALVAAILGNDELLLQKPLDLAELHAALAATPVAEFVPVQSTSALRRLAVRAKHGVMDFAPSRTLLRALCRAGLVPAAIWNRLPVEQRFEVPFGPDIAFRYDSIDGDVIGQTLYLFGAQAYEYETTEVFARLARRSSVVLDIGANTGLFSLLACAANPNGRVVSFEPVDRVRDMLIRNITINGWSSRCDIRSEAVSDSIGEVTFHVPTGNVPSSARFESTFEGHPGKEVIADQITVDSLGLERVDLVKIDVEGFEDRALRGMRETIARCGPDFILECNPGGPHEAINEMMAAEGYGFHHLRRGGVEAVDRIEPDAAGHDRNFLLSRRPSDALFD